MTVLLDSNVLIALVTPAHVHHDAAEHWFTSRDAAFATCPITQGALMRIAMLGGASAAEAAHLLAELTAHERHEFWPDDLQYAEVRVAGIVGHRQVTDAYLAALARARGGELATFDRGLAALHTDVCRLVAT